jgi:hypothetical protein
MARLHPCAEDVGGTDGHGHDRRAMDDLQRSLSGSASPLTRSDGEPRGDIGRAPGATMAWRASRCRTTCPPRAGGTFRGTPRPWCPPSKPAQTTATHYHGCRYGCRQDRRAVSRCSRLALKSHIETLKIDIERLTAERQADRDELAVAHAAADKATAELIELARRLATIAETQAAAEPELPARSMGRRARA